MNGRYVTRCFYKPLCKTSEMEGNLEPTNFYNAPKQSPYDTTWEQVTGQRKKPGPHSQKAPEKNSTSK